MSLLVLAHPGSPNVKQLLSQKTEWWDVGVVVWDEVQTCI